MCVNKTIDQCQGPWALDIRQLIQAEFATWVPDDPNCKVVDMTSEETACQVLKNVTIYFVGESLTRQMYISVLGFLRDKKYETHVLVDNSTAARNCHTYYRYSPPCRPYFLQDSIECSGTTRIRFRQLLSSNEASEMLSQFRELLNVPNSFYVLGFGFHNRFQAEPVVTKTRIRFRQLLSSNEASEMLSQFRELLNVPNSFYVLGFGFHNRFQAEPVVTNAQVMNVNGLHVL
uniref:Uncharacterized protein n=1 Tax=Biomphalaria glabrata TaxID=6526 RepID=A0A2C9KF98_BIOGL